MSRYRTSKIYDITDFISWEEREELEISPKYQRNSVWNNKAKSYLIDTIFMKLFKNLKLLVYKIANIMLTWLSRIHINHC